MNYHYISSASLSDIGRRRKNNQDAEVSIPDAGIFCVADGMGGGEAGEVASKKVIDAVQSFANDLHEAPGTEHLKYKMKYLSRTLHRAGCEIFDFAAEQGYTTCGTTAVILVFDFNQPRRAGVLHVGDSRLYRLRRGLLTQITIDHSAENEAALGGYELPDSMKHVITRAIGGHEHTEVEQNFIDVESGDLYLICSDGLSGMVTDEIIQETLVSKLSEPPGRSVQDLISTANENGGKDNITVSLVCVQDFAGFHEESGELMPYDVDEDDEDTLDRPALSGHRLFHKDSDAQNLDDRTPFSIFKLNPRCDTPTTLENSE